MAPHHSVRTGKPAAFVFPYAEQSVLSLCAIAMYVALNEGSNPKYGGVEASTTWAASIDPDGAELGRAWSFS